MEEKKLGEEELKEVTGGTGAQEEMVGMVHRIGICGKCGETLYFPASGHGYFTCPNCGSSEKY